MHDRQKKKKKKYEVVTTIDLQKVLLFRANNRLYNVLYGSNKIVAWREIRFSFFKLLTIKKNLIFI